jgi:hypothetical protein
MTAVQAERLAFSQRMGGLQRSFTEVIRESTDKRAASGRSARDQGEPSIVNRILREIGVKQQLSPLLPKEVEERSGAGNEPVRANSRQSWYQKAASKIGLKSAAEKSGLQKDASLTNVLKSASKSDVHVKTVVQGAEKSDTLPHLGQNKHEIQSEQINVVEKPEMSNVIQPSEMSISRTVSNRERTESVCSDNLPDLSLVQEETVTASEAIASITEACEPIEAQCVYPEEPVLLVREIDTSGLFLTSFDHDDDDDYDEAGVVVGDHEVPGELDNEQLSQSCAESSAEPSADLPARRLLLQDHVSNLLDTVLQQKIAASEQGSEDHVVGIKRTHVEQLLVEQISKLIDKTLAREVTSESGPVMDKETGGSCHVVEEEQSMALVKVDRSDCESCGDLSEHENVYDVFDLR